ncbi:cell number regulator 6-like [Musa troglodytarum]|uniref:Cell number regulator 6-like n=1 Tax=Musa troglodytarum TaxID=320322 RepID=A0A9E7KE89_9LILI|nr:cell number regulator 6-like [Musa troglodytarum]
MMSDVTVPSSYVKLTKDQAVPLEEIRPGELNQPVRVPQLEVRRCAECGQPLPESYEPPADEAWTTGICGCAEDPESCRTGLFCPCVLFGRNVERLREDTPWTTPCMCHALCVEGGIALAVATANSPCDPCMVHCCMHWCAICQEHREMKGRLSDNHLMPMTVVNAPPVQEMSSHNSVDSEAGPQQSQHAELETQAL